MGRRIELGGEKGGHARALFFIFRSFFPFLSSPEAMFVAAKAKLRENTGRERQARESRSQAWK